MLKNEIESWLDKYQIIDYVVRDDLTVDVKGNVKLSSKDLTRLPVQFNHVSGNFDIYANKLITLEGCPHIVMGNFTVNNNKLKSLLHSPEYVGGNYHLGFNEINDFSNFKSEIKGILYCDNNPLKHLDDLKADIGKNVYFYQENNINFRLDGYEDFYDNEGFFNIPFNEVQKIQLRNKLTDNLEETKNSPRIKI